MKLEIFHLVHVYTYVQTCIYIGAQDKIYKISLNENV